MLIIHRLENVKLWKEVIVFSFATSLVIIISFGFKEYIKSKKNKKVKKAKFVDFVLEFSVTFMSSIRERCNIFRKV